ncbi:MAG: hypothetical protein D6682_02440 [Zetaproteobacteria bacterium]|nr:MAG: hypothetical protein D6682_02440 [Zetaproteobacteria bacterium]
METTMIHPSEPHATDRPLEEPPTRGRDATRLCALLLAVGLLGGCAAAGKSGFVAMPSLSTSSQKSEPAPTTPGAPKVELPERVAVLPFLNRTKADEAFDIMRKTIFNHLSTRNYRLPHLHDVDQRLAAAGWSDPAAIEQVDTGKLADTLGVDGVLYGEITHFDRIYLGIYAQIAVGVRLRLVARDGREVWRGEDTVRTHAGGVSMTPVGLILNALTAAAHLREVNMYRAADDLARELIPKIPMPPRMGSVAPPRILQVVHDGVGRILHYGDRLKVAMEGDPNRKGFVRIEGWRSFDLREEPKGFYSAEITIPPKVNIRQAALTGVLADDNGLESSQVSPLGLITIDNQPPAPVEGLTATATGEAIRLQWRSPDRDIYAFAVARADHALGPFTPIGRSKDARFTDRAVRPFATYYYRVAAIDLAGNRGEAVTVPARLLPDPRFAEAAPLASPLGGELHGLHVLRAADGPFRLQQPLRVAPDGVLLVEPGVSIVAGDQGALRIEGTLRMAGTSTAPIRLQGGRGITLAGTAPVVIEQATIAQAAIAFTIQAGAPRIHRCRIIDSRYSAFDIQGVSRPQILENEIAGASSGAVVVSGRAQPVLHGNLLHDNQPFHLQNGSVYRIDATGNRWRPPAGPTTILGDVDYSGAQP